MCVRADVQFLEVAVSQIISTPVRHRIELDAVREFHLVGGTASLVAVRVTTKSFYPIFDDNRFLPQCRLLRMTFPVVCTMVGRGFRPRVSQLGRRKSRVRLAGSCGRCVRILAEFNRLAAWGYVVIVGRGTPRRSDACPGSIAGIRRHGVGQEERGREERGSRDSGRRMSSVFVRGCWMGDVPRSQVVPLTLAS